MVVRVDFTRISRLAEALREISPHAVKAMVEKDPQYKAVRRIAERHGSLSVALVVANALVSYRLTARGEDYWTEYARYLEAREVKDDIVMTVIDFLYKSKGNRLLRDQKTKRLRRIAGLLKDIARRPLGYRDLSFLLEALSRALSARGYEKTLAFAAKMAYYAYRSLGVDVEGKWLVPIPVDRRIALLTATSGILEGASPSSLLSRPRLVVEAWSSVSRLSGIAMIDLDTLLWLPMKGADELLSRGLLARARDVYASMLVSYTGGLVSWAAASRVSAELLHRLP
ncbi:MAG: N-glycosylase/DNA lyase [Pyrodictiaceae archaeon]